MYANFHEWNGNVIRDGMNFCHRDTEATETDN